MQKKEWEGSNHTFPLQLLFLGLWSTRLFSYKCCCVLYCFRFV